MVLVPYDEKPKPVKWTGRSREDLSVLPDEVKNRIGSALWDAQLGRKSTITKPLVGFGGAGVLEVIDDFDGDTYRAVYTVRFAGVVFVLHVFQKKSHRGSALPRRDMATIRRRLAAAHEEYRQWLENQ